MVAVLAPVPVPYGALWAAPQGAELPPFVGYEPMSVRALMGLYWKAGVLKPDNEQAVTEFIQVSACKLYHDRFEDDFAWPELIKSTQEYLNKYSQSFPTQFMFTQPVALGRYLPDKGYFEISGDTDYVNVRKMFIADYASFRPPCDGTTMPREAPMRAILELPSAYTLDRIPMSREMARQTIAFIDGRMKATDIHNTGRNRFAYVRFFVTVRGYDPALDDGGISMMNGPAVTFVGTLDGYEVYADDERTKLLLRWANPAAGSGEPGTLNAGSSGPSLVDVVPKK